MKTWARLFFTGVLLGILGAAVTKVVARYGVVARASAEGEAKPTAPNPNKNTDPKLKRVEDPEISGLRVQVPMSAEAELALKRKEKELKEKEAALADLQDKLTVEDERLKNKIEEFEKSQESVQLAREEEKKKDLETLKKIAKTFETMSPKKASAILAAMNEDLVVDIFGLMKEKRVAPVLEAMEPARAMTFTSLLAKRKPAAAAPAKDGKTEIRP